MATAPISPSPLCRPEEDPFLLLESTFHAVRHILKIHRGRPLRRSWMDRPYGEEEITILEEEVLPALSRCLERISELDDWLLMEVEFMARCRLEGERLQVARLKPVLA